VPPRLVVVLHALDPYCRLKVSFVGLPLSLPLPPSLSLPLPMQTLSWKMPSCYPQNANPLNPRVPSVYHPNILYNGSRDLTLSEGRLRLRRVLCNRRKAVRVSALIPMQHLFTPPLLPSISNAIHLQHSSMQSCPITPACARFLLRFTAPARESYNTASGFERAPPRTQGPTKGQKAVVCVPAGSQARSDSPVVSGDGPNSA